jgi:two-component sensor histidine kinase
VDGEKYILTVRDNGVGLPEGLDYRKSRSMGMQLVVVLAQQLGSELVHDGSDGATFTMTFSEYMEASPEVL